MSSLLSLIFPERASTMAWEVDALYGFLLLVGIFFSVLIAVSLAVLAYRFRRRPLVSPVKGDPHHAEAYRHSDGHLILEIAWTVIPLGLTMVMFVWGAEVFFRLQRPPDDALQLYAIGKQWMWKFQHPEGPREINELHVPIGRPVKLSMSSEDVIHSFYVPAFRVKQDVVPGRYTAVWFEATKPGTYHLFCTEYCGTQHSGMIGQVVAMEPKDYEAWLGGGGSRLSLADAGKKLFEERACVTCHEQGATGRGPSLHGLLGHEVVLKGGAKVVADEEYLRESILDPAAKVVEGYDPVMPTFQGLLTEEQLLELVEYIKTLKAEGAGAQTADAAGAKE